MGSPAPPRPCVAALHFPVDPAGALSTSDVWPAAPLLWGCPVRGGLFGISPASAPNSSTMIAGRFPTSEGPGGQSQCGGPACVSLWWCRLREPVAFAPGAALLLSCWAWECWSVCQGRTQGRCRLTAPVHPGSFPLSGTPQCGFLPGHPPEGGTGCSLLMAFACVSWKDPEAEHVLLCSRGARASSLVKSYSDLPVFLLGCLNLHFLSMGSFWLY